MVWQVAPRAETMTLKDGVLALLSSHKAAAAEDKAMDDVENGDTEDRFGLQTLYHGRKSPAESSKR